MDGCSSRSKAGVNVYAEKYVEKLLKFTVKIKLGKLRLEEK